METAGKTRRPTYASGHAVDFMQGIIGCLVCALPVAVGCGGATADRSGSDAGVTDGAPSDTNVVDTTVHDGGDARFDGSPSGEGGPCIIDSSLCLTCVNGSCAKEVNACQDDDSGLDCPDQYLSFKMCVCNVENGVTSSDPAALDDCEGEFKHVTDNAALLTCIESSCASECLPPSYPLHDPRLARAS
jgi:hypothetical protein